MKRKIKRTYKYKGYNSDINSSLNIEQTQLYDQLTKVQEMIHSKLSEAKKLRRLNYLCQHTNSIKHEGKMPSHQAGEGLSASQYAIIQLPQQGKDYHEQINYYDMFWKLFLINENTAWKVNKLYDNVEQMQLKTQQIQNLFSDRQDLLRDSQTIGFQKVLKKRSKSKSEDVEKNETKVLCPYQRCYKQYCSDISLNLHIKLKHNGGNKSERQFYAEKIWKSRQNKKHEPLVPIYFAPGYIEEYGMLTGRMNEQIYNKQVKQNKWVSYQVDRKSFMRVQKQEQNRQKKRVIVKRQN